jgi:hypothetical protein
MHDMRDFMSDSFVEFCCHSHNDNDSQKPSRKVHFRGATSKWVRQVIDKHRVRVEGTTRFPFPAIIKVMEKQRSAKDGKRAEISAVRKAARPRLAPKK